MLLLTPDLKSVLSMFNKCFQQHTLLQNSFVRLTVVNNVGPYIGHMVYDVTMNDIMLSNCVMYVLKDISRLKKTQEEYGILVTNLLAFFPNLQTLLKFRTRFFFFFIALYHCHT